MTYDPDRHHRRSTRLKGHDYRRAGAYFVTVCTWERECLLGEIWHGQVCLNALGQIVAETWQEIPRHFERAAVAALVVMPNHIHGVIVLKNEYGAGAASAARDGRGTACRAPTDLSRRPSTARRPPASASTSTTRGMSTALGREAFGQPVAGSLPTIMRSFKSASTKRVNALRDSRGAALWQRGYNEHIIRNDGELRAVRQYIADNPIHWREDPENPARARLA